MPKVIIVERIISKTTPRLRYTTLKALLFGIRISPSKIFRELFLLKKSVIPEIIIPRIIKITIEKTSVSIDIGIRVP